MPSPRTDFAENLNFLLYLIVDHMPGHARQRIALVIASVAALTVACANRSDVSNAIRELIVEDGIKTVRLVDATRFTWDQAYLFGPYTPRSTVCGILRIQENDCERQIPFESVDDGEMSIAFLAGDSLVHYASHHRRNGDFTPVPGRPLSPQTAIFKVVQGDVANGPAPWIRLVLLTK